MLFSFVLQILRVRLFWVVLALAAALQLIGRMDAKDFVDSTQERCRNMQVWEDTGGAYGWPVDHRFMREHCRGYGAPAAGN